MKKILFVIDSLETGGAEKSLLEIISRFRVYKPIVCHLYTGHTLKHDYEQRGIEVISLNVSGHYNFSTAALKLENEVNRIRPILIHSSLFRSDIVCRRLKKRNNLPLVNSFVNNSYHRSRYEKAGFVMKFKLFCIQAFDAVTARRVDLFISNSETIRKSNARALMVPQEKIKVIYRGRPVEDFGIDPSIVNNLRREMKLEGYKILLNVSRLLDRKGQLDLLRAFRQVLKIRPAMKLLIAGEGPYRNRLEQEISDSGLTDSVLLLGTRTDIPVLLKMADVFVFPSYYEGLPGVLIEAMMAKIPIVASDIPENLECVTSSSAFIYPSGNVEELAKRILHAVESPETAKENAIRAYSMAIRKFNIESIAGQYEKVYNELLNA